MYKHLLLLTAILRKTLLYQHLLVVINLPEKCVLFSGTKIS